MYLYRAAGKFGKTLDFMLSGQRDEAAAEAFFQQAACNNSTPEKVVIDKSGAKPTFSHSLLAFTGAV